MSAEESEKWGGRAETQHERAAGRKGSVLVVEDDASVRNLITTTLKVQNYQYQTASTGNRAISEAATVQPDVILMDLGLPDMDGVEVIRNIRTWSLAPIIVISARSEDRDKVEALDAGADDYLTKPFSVEELLARLRATLRRLEYLESVRMQDSSVFWNGSLKIDYAAGSVFVEKREIHLMPLEYSLLVLLARNVGKVLTYRFILDKVWTNAIESDISSLRVYMASLRKKIEKDTASLKYIQTHVGVGYRMIRVEEND